MSLEAAIDTFDLEGYVEQHGAKKIKETPYVEWLMTCPVCQREKLTVNVTRRTWHCWICEQYGPMTARGKRSVVRGAGGVLGLVELLERCSREEASRKVLEEARIVLGTMPVFRTRDVFAPSPAQAVPAIPHPPHWQPIYGILPYMQKRGITMEDVHSFGLYWCSAGRYVNRLVFPVYEDGQLVYFQARAMWEPRPGEQFIKALNPPKEHTSVVSSDVLMNLDQARHYPRVAIVEGPVDCVHAGPSAVATFGKRISDRQLARLLKAGVRAIDLMWDGPTVKEPEGAWPEMCHVAEKLATLFDIRLVFLPAGDPGEYTRDQLNWHRQHSAYTPEQVRQLV